MFLLAAFSIANGTYVGHDRLLSRQSCTAYVCTYTLRPGEHGQGAVGGMVATLSSFFLFSFFVTREFQKSFSASMVPTFGEAEVQEGGSSVPHENIESSAYDAVLRDQCMQEVKCLPKSD